MKQKLPFFTKMLTLAALISLTMVPAALAQQLPAGIGGYWKVAKMYPKKPLPPTGSCMANPAFFNAKAKNTRILMSDRNIVWGATSATDPMPQVHNLDPGDFTARYGQSGATLKDLELARSTKIEVIELGAPGTLPFDAIVVKDPSTLYFEHCGLFMQAMHDSGFVAPPLPNQ